MTEVFASAEENQLLAVPKLVTSRPEGSNENAAFTRIGEDSPF
jgi:hypothetical protein